LSKQLLQLFIALTLVSSSAWGQGVSWELMDELDQELPPIVAPAEESSLPPAESYQSSPMLTNDSGIGGGERNQIGLLRSGVTETELVEILGEPDQIESGQGITKNWRYGASSVFLLDGKVSGWTDGGDLEQRVRFGLDFRPGKSRKIYFSYNWLNAWKLTPTPSLADVIDELLD